MSNPNPRPVRRRIAGERRPARLGPPSALPEDLRPTEPPAGDVDADRVDIDRVDTDRVDADWLDSDGTPPEREPGTFEEPAGTRATGPSWLVVALLGALAVALVAAVAVLGLGVWDVRQVREDERVAEATRAAPAEAEQAAAAILSYGHRTLDADQKAAEKYLTPSYREDYADTFERLVRPNATKLKANVEAQVRGSGVTHADPDRVNVLLYVNQTTKSTANGGEPQVALNRVQLAMVRQGDDWLVDDITSY
jgi:Mce-associated membrane protein